MFFLSKYTYVHSVKAGQSVLNDTRTHHHMTFLNLYIDGVRSMVTNEMEIN